MIKIGFEHLSRWCAEHGYALENWTPALASDADAVSVDLPVPSGVQAVTEFLDALVSTGVGSAEILVWIRDWTIWNERAQEIGLRHLSLLASSADSEREAGDGHIYLLEQSDWSAAIALLLIPVLYSWDAHLFNSSGNALVDISHDGFVRVWLSRNDQALNARLKPWQS
jgi:hypothetical protein